MDILKGPNGGNSSTRWAGFIVGAYALLIGAWIVFQGSDAGTPAIEVYKTAIYTAGIVLTGGKLSEAAKSWGIK